MEGLNFDFIRGSADDRHYY